MELRIRSLDHSWQEIQFNSGGRDKQMSTHSLSVRCLFTTTSVSIWYGKGSSRMRSFSCWNALLR